MRTPASWAGRVSCANAPWPGALAYRRLRAAPGTAASGRTGQGLESESCPLIFRGLAATLWGLWLEVLTSQLTQFRVESHSDVEVEVAMSTPSFTLWATGGGRRTTRVRRSAPHRAARDRVGLLPARPRGRARDPGGPSPAADAGGLPAGRGPGQRRVGADLRVRPGGDERGRGLAAEPDAGRGAGDGGPGAAAGLRGGDRARQEPADPAAQARREGGRAALVGARAGARLGPGGLLRRDGHEPAERLLHRRPALHCPSTTPRRGPRWRWCCCST